MKAVHLTYQMNRPSFVHNIYKPQRVALCAHGLDLVRRNGCLSENTSEIDHVVVVNLDLKRYPQPHIRDEECATEPGDEGPCWRAI